MVLELNEHWLSWIPGLWYHPLEHKERVVKSLVHRVDTIVSDERDQEEEKSHVKKALTMNGYRDWLVNSIPTIQPSLESMFSVSSDDTSDDVRENEIDTTTKKPTRKKSPYVEGVSEQFRKVFKQHGVPAYFKSINTLRELLARPSIYR